MIATAPLSPPLPLAVADARICLTATGILIHHDQALLIKHKKLGVWLSPGGHLEDNELPHQAAEREFWEETGIKVRARIDLRSASMAAGSSAYVPSPIATNLHWISYENYLNRQSGGVVSGNRHCEQHVALIYLMEPATKSVKYRQNVEETDGIGWFAQADLESLDTLESARSEIALAFELV